MPLHLCAGVAEVAVSWDFAIVILLPLKLKSIPFLKHCLLLKSTLF
jgi:hypothetical protein